MKISVSLLGCGYLLSVLLLHNPSVASETPLHSFSATYNIHSDGFRIGRMERRLIIAPDNHYRFESKIELTGLIALLRDGSVEETSEGELSGGQIRPRHYAYRRVTADKHKEATISFDWENSRITTTAEGEQSDLAAAPGALDKLVYQLALMQDLARENASLHYAVADDGELKAYELSRAGQETVEINGRPTVAIKVIYTRKGSTRKTTLWCAPDYAFLPIKIEYLEADGGVTIATLTAFE